MTTQQKHNLVNPHEDLSLEYAVWDLLYFSLDPKVGTRSGRRIHVYGSPHKRLLRRISMLTRDEDPKLLEWVHAALRDGQRGKINGNSLVLSDHFVNQLARMVGLHENIWGHRLRESQ